MKTVRSMLRIVLILALILGLGSCSEETPQDVDTESPTANLFEPDEGDQIFGTITIKATASDNDRVSSVEFLANGDPLGADDTPPYQLVWNPSTPRTDIVDYTLVARATDPTGNVGSSDPVGVTYINDDVAPTVQITAPQDLAVLEGPVTITANADDDVEVTSVRFLVDGADIGGDTEAPYEYFWAVGDWADGELHELTVKATDSTGNVGSSSIVVRVSTIAAPPEVTIVFPNDGSQVSEDNTVIEATATDTDIVLGVVFYVDGDSIGFDPEPPYLQPWAILFWAADEEHTVEATAEDERGNIGSAPLVTVTVAATAGLELISPEDETVFVSAQDDTLTWEFIATALQYEYQVSTDTLINEIAYTSLIADTSIVLSGLTEDWYYWRTRAQNAGEHWSEWTDTWSFHVGMVFSQTYGLITTEQLLFMDPTADGGYILAGFQKPTTADSLLWLIRTTESGDTLWTHQFGEFIPEEEDGRAAVFGEIAHCARETNDGGIIMVGATEGLEEHAGDLWLLKTDADGFLLWDHTYGGEGVEEGLSVDQTSDGGFMIVGYTTSFGAGQKDLWLLRTDALGDTLWTRSVGGDLDDEGVYLERSADDGFIIAGSTESVGSVDQDYWLIKLDAGGDTEWSYIKGGAMDDWATCIRSTLDGYIAVGYTESYGAGSTDLLVVKLDLFGNELWSRTHGGTGIDGGRYIDPTSDGTYIVTGETGPAWAGQVDLWLLKLDGIGGEQWSKAIGSNGNDIGTSVYQTPDSGFIVGGYTSSFGHGARDFWLTKTDWKGNTVPLED